MNVYVFGLGHIGLPMATWIAMQDYEVIGIDKNPDVITEIQNGTVKIEEYYQEQHISQLALSLIKRKGSGSLQIFYARMTNLLFL